MDSTHRASRVFVGSSSEAHPIALAVQENLEASCDVTVWNHDIFRLSSATIDSLIFATTEFDFAILICSPDDNVVSRSKDLAAPRDNIIFESGLFMGALGKDRVFLVRPNGIDLKLPSDLAGFTVGQYRADRSDGRLTAATAPMCKRIEDQILKIGPKPAARNNAEFSAAICYRYENGHVEFLLTKTTKGRWIFPKGIVLTDEPTEVAALRYAEDEGGALGRIEIRASTSFSYLKEERGVEQTVIAHAINVSNTVQPVEEFRVPKWFKLDEALLALTEGRRGKYAEELRKAIRWASVQVENAKSDVQRLAGALPYRLGQDGQLEFLLVTSRTSSNWIVPKGHVIGAESPSVTAAREALEEAGIKGTLKIGTLGNYGYRRASKEFDVEVFALRVEEMLDPWEEQGARRRKWFAQSEAVDVVNELGLQTIIASFTL